MCSARVKSLRRESSLVDEVQASYLKALKSLDPEFNPAEQLEPLPKLRETHNQSEALDHNIIHKDRSAHAPLKQANIIRAGDLHIVPEVDTDNDRMSNISDLASHDSASRKGSLLSMGEVESEGELKPAKWLTAVRRVEAKSRDQREETTGIGNKAPPSMGHTGSSVPSTAMSLDSLENSVKPNDNDLTKPGPALHRMDGGVSPLNFGKLPINFGLLESLASYTSDVIVGQDFNALSIDSLNTMGRKLELPPSLNPAAKLIAEQAIAPEDCSIFNEDVSLSQLNDPQRRSSIRLQSKALLANLIGEGDSSSEEIEASLASSNGSKGSVEKDDHPVLTTNSVRRGSVRSAAPIANEALRSEVENFDNSEDSLKSDASPTSPILCGTRADIEDDDVLMGTTQLYVSHDLETESTHSNESPGMMSKGSKTVVSGNDLLEWKAGKVNSELKEIGQAIEICVNAVNFDSNTNGPVNVIARCLRCIYLTSLKS